MDTVKGPNRTEPDEEMTRLAEAHQLTLLRLCFAWLHDRALAEDAVQETFLKAYKSLGQFRGEAGEKTWVCRIAVNCCRDMARGAWFRHVDRRVALDMLPEPAADASPRDRELTAEIMALPIRLREAVLLYYFENMTTAE